MNLNSPLIITKSKSRFGDYEIDRALAKACLAARGVDRPLPVLMDGRIIAFVVGKQGSSDVWWKKYDKYWCGFTSYDDMINKITNSGQSYYTYWAKRCSSTMVIDTWYDLWPVEGYPIAGTYAGAAKTAVQWNDTKEGCIYLRGDKSPSTKHLLSMSLYNNAAQQITMLYDRVLTYEACPIANSNQSMTNGVAAQRYVSGIVWY